MATVIFYEKPGCINNTKQKAMLVAAGHRLIVHNLLVESWTAERLRPFFGQRPVPEWFNPTAPQIKAGNVVPNELDAPTALQLMTYDPLLIRRPLMQIGDRYEVGFDVQKIDQWIGLHPQPESPPGPAVDMAALDLETCPRSQIPDPTSCSSHKMQTSERWKAYYDAVAGRPPRETLLKAIANFNAEAGAVATRSAIDLGCGDGRDTVELLRQGWQVLGLDGEPEAIARLRDRQDIDLTHLETQLMRFEWLTSLPPAVLINASYSLPFCPPECFPHLWQMIVNTLPIGGRFCGQLLGDRDTWAENPKISYQTRSQVQGLLRSFEIEWLEEEEHPGKTALGEDKYWHLFHIVARKVCDR